MSKSKSDKNGTGEVQPGAAPSPRVGKASHGELLAEMTDRVTSLTQTNRQLKRKIFDLYTIFEISRDFNSVLEYETLLDTFILTSLAQVSASKAAIFLPSENNSQRLVLTRAKGSGRFPDRRRFFQRDSKLLEYVARLNRPLATGEIMGEMARRGEQSILEVFHPGLIVPLIYQTRLSGVFLITDKLKGRTFEMDDIEFLSVLGNQISVAFENARLYEAEREAIRQLRSAQQQLVYSERLAALGEMSAKVAHEINNPLGIVKNYLQLINRSARENVEARGYVDIVGQEIDRIARIVRELLDFHHPHAPAFEDTDVREVLDSVLTLTARQLESKKIAVDRDYDSGVPLIAGSSENLKQIFLNIIINAADVMPDGGHVKVDIRRAKHKVVIRISDTGPGIKPDLIPRIFEPFFTTKELGHGTGLGLSVCYGIIKRHRGSITYNNTSVGGCFTIKLPIERQDTDEPPD